MNADLIVLNLTKTGETSIVLHTISREYGRRGFVTKLTRKIPMSMFLPLNILEADITESPRTDLWKASSIIVKHSLNGIRSNLYKNTMTLFMSEVLYRAIKDGANEDGLFEWCERSILTLDSLESDFSNYHLRFLLELAGVLGFSPDAGSLEPFCGDNAAVMREFVRAPFPQAMLMPMKGELRNALAESLLRYISYHSESSLDVRSLRVLREIFV